MSLGPGGFTVDDWATVSPVLDPHRDVIYANMAGHLHLDADVDESEDSLQVHIVDALWDDVVRVLLVEVWDMGDRLEYRHEAIEVL